MDPQRFCKLTRLVHFQNDVAASDESAVDGWKRRAIVCKRLDDCGREAALRTRRAAFHKENDGVELDGLGDTRLRTIDVNDVRHKSVSRHDSAEFVDIGVYAPI